METVKENENYRVRIVSDDSGEKPYDEGATPILSREFGSYRMEWKAFNAQGEPYADAVTEVYRRFDGGRDDTVARYLRIFHGAYSVAYDSSQYQQYLAFDTAAWRESVGFTDEFLESATGDNSKIADGSLTEVISWANGEVYGYVLERRVKSVTHRTDYATGRELAPVEVDEWYEVDSCYGFYGWDSVKEAAEEAFDNATD